MKSIQKLLCTALVFVAGAAHSADIIVLNFDEPGVGFNDPTPVAPVGGNPATTLGEQRMQVFEYAAELWGAQLKSTVEIQLAAFFGPLTCSPTSGAIGSAIPASVFASFPDLPLADTWYVGALADALTREDLDPGYVDMIARFNGDIGVNPDCLTGLTWYNGLDNNHDPASEIDLLTVVMHEMAHGLGFITLSRDSTGAYFFGLPDSYLVNMYDLDFDRSWEQLSNAERLVSQTNTHRLVWTGPEVTTRSQFQLDPRFSVIVQPPAPIEGSYEAQPADFGPQIPLNGGFTGNLKNARDEVGVETDGCEPITNNVRNRVAIIDRGTCTFVLQVANAQAAGASAVIIVNDGPGLPRMDGDDPTITIPAVGVSQSDGELFKPFAVADPLTQVKFRYDDDFLAGTTDGYVRLYAPNPVDPGLSKSHFDISATPNLLMEPFINDDLVPATWLDLTVRALKDIGWKLQ